MVDNVRRECIMSMYEIYPLSRKLVFDTFDKKKYDITRTQQIIMLSLCIEGTLTMSQLASKINTSNEQATRAVAQLVDKGFVIRMQNPDNRRVINIRLTDEAMRFMEKMKNEILDDILGKFSGISDGDMKKMFDTTVEADKVIAYNLFPQTATNGTGASTTDVKTSMPHFVLKLATSGTASTRWLTIRALRTTDALPGTLVTSFDAGKVYVLNAADININQYSAKLKVTANDTAGPEIPEPIDPTDPNPEPVGKDLDVLVKITEWTIVNVKPEW